MAPRRIHKKGLVMSKAVRLHMGSREAIDYFLNQARDLNINARLIASASNILPPCHPRHSGLCVLQSYTWGLAAVLW